MRYFFLNFKHCERGGLRYPTIVLNEAEQQLPIFPTFSWKISIVGLHSWPVRRWWYNGPIAPQGWYPGIPGNFPKNSFTVLSWIFFKNKLFSDIYVVSSKFPGMKIIRKITSPIALLSFCDAINESKRKTWRKWTWR